MRRRLLSLLCLMLLLFSAAPSPAADAIDSGATAEGAIPEPGPLTWEQVMEQNRPDTTIRATAAGTLQAEWLSSRQKVELPAKAGGWTTLWVGSDQSVGYRPIGAANSAIHNEGNAAHYQRAWDGADLVVQVEPNRYKENLVLAAPPKRHTWTYAVQLNNLTGWQDEQGIEFGFGDRPLLAIRDLVATDASGVSIPVQATLRTVGTELFIDLDVDPQWLANAAYPVQVDPTTIGTESSNMVDSSSQLTQLSNGYLAVALSERVYISTDKGNTWTQPFTMSDAKTTKADCITADKSGSFYVLYQATVTKPYLRWRFRKFSWTGSGWTMGSYVSLTSTDAYQQLGCAAAYDPKNNNVILVYSRYYSDGSSEFDWNYYRVGTGSLSSAYQLDTAYSGSIPFEISTAVDGSTGSIFFAWPDLLSGSTMLRRYTTSTGSSYTAGTTLNLGGTDYRSVTVDASGNAIVANNSGGSLAAIKYVPSTGTTTTTPLESSIKNDRVSIANLGGDLYLYFVGTNNAVYYRQYKKSVGAWQSRVLLQAGDLTNVETPPTYFNTDGAWVLWQDATANTVFFGGVIPPKAPNAPGNLDPSAGNWKNTMASRLSWTYSNSNAADGQLAYQVQVKNGSGSLILDTGRVASANQYYDVPSGMLTDGAQYSWAVTTWDAQGNLQGPWSVWAGFGVDLTAPTVTAAINGGGAYTASTDVTINIAAVDSASGPASYNTTYNGVTSAWQPYATSVPFTLAATDGVHTIGVNVRDQAGNTAGANAAITLDTTPPTVSITRPAAGGVGGLVPVQADAADNVALQTVEFYANDTDLIGTATAAPWQADWNTTVLPNGPYTLTAVAQDIAGHAAVSAPVSVTVDNHEPTVAIASPTEGQSVRGIYSVQSSVSDPVGIRSVEYYVDGNLLGSATAAPFAFPWNTAGVANGVHTLTAKASNAYGNTNTASVSVTVDNSPVTGTLTVAENSTSGPGETLRLTSTSAWAVTWNTVEYRKTGESTWYLQSGTGTYTDGVANVSWQVPTAPATWQIRAGLTDGQGNSGYTGVLELVLPDWPLVTASTGNQGDILLGLPTGNSGAVYEIRRAESDPFIWTEANSDLLSSAFTGTTYRDGTNHVANSSFEEGADLEGVPVHWVPLPSTGTYTLETGSATHGSSVLHLTRATTQGQAGLLQTIFTGRELEGRAFTLSGWLRTVSVTGGGGAGARLEFRFLDRDGTLLATQATPAVTGTSDWQRYAVTAVAPLKTYTIQVAVMLDQASGDLWADGIQAEPGATPSAFTPGGLVDSSTYYYQFTTWMGPLHSQPGPAVHAIYRSPYGCWGPAPW